MSTYWWPCLISQPQCWHQPHSWRSNPKISYCEFSSLFWSEDSYVSCFLPTKQVHLPTAPKHEDQSHHWEPWAPSDLHYSEPALLRLNPKRKLDSHKKNKVKLQPSLCIKNNQFRGSQKPQHKTWNSKIIKVKHKRKQFEDISIKKFLKMSLKA